MKARASLLLPSLVLIASCNHAGSVVGKWKGSVPPATLQAQKNNPMAGMLQGMASAFTLDIKADKTFAMSMIIPVEGTWELAGNTLMLIPTKMMGIDAKSLAQKGSNTAQNKPIALTLSEDGKTLTMSDPSKPNDNLNFVRDQS